MTETPMNPFDPHYPKPAPIVPPPDLLLDRIEAAAQLASWHCPHCSARVEADSRAADGRLRATGIEHEKGCPQWLPDWPPDKA